MNPVDTNGPCPKGALDFPNEAGTVLGEKFWIQDWAVRALPRELVKVTVRLYKDSNWTDEQILADKHLSDGRVLPGWDRTHPGVLERHVCGSCVIMLPDDWGKEKSSGACTCDQPWNFGHEPSCPERSVR